MTLEDDDDDRGCGMECGCDTRAEHDAAMEESMQEFLRNPGPPPAHFSPNDVERALTAMNRAKAKP